MTTYTNNHKKVMCQSQDGLESFREFGKAILGRARMYSASTIIEECHVLQTPSFIVVRKCIKITQGRWMSHPLDYIVIRFNLFI